MFLAWGILAVPWCISPRAHLPIRKSFICLVLFLGVTIFVFEVYSEWCYWQWHHFLWVVVNVYKVRMPVCIDMWDNCVRDNCGSSIHQPQISLAHSYHDDTDSFRYMTRWIFICAHWHIPVNIHICAHWHVFCFVLLGNSDSRTQSFIEPNHLFVWDNFGYLMHQSWSSLTHSRMWHDLMMMIAFIITLGEIM